MSTEIDKLNIDDILERIGKISGARTQKDIAEALKVSDKVVWNWKNRKTIPWLEILKFSEEKKIPFIALLTGRDSNHNIDLDSMLSSIHKTLDDDLHRDLDTVLESGDKNAITSVRANIRVAKSLVEGVKMHSEEFKELKKDISELSKKLPPGSDQIRPAGATSGPGGKRRRSRKSA
jgi:transcriptional regulator with XRE-family HTH domain